MGEAGPDVEADEPGLPEMALTLLRLLVGWACVVLGLVLELIFPYRIASAAAAILGFLTAFLAHHLAGSGDTLEMMQAVLDTNFWLATHVTAVTIGYAATLLAGVIGVLYILFGLIAPPGSSPGGKIQHIVVVLLFALALVFAGASVRLPRQRWSFASISEGLRGLRALYYEIGPHLRATYLVIVLATFTLIVTYRRSVKSFIARLL